MLKKTSVDYDMKYMHRFMLFYFMFITLFHCTTNWSNSFASIYIIYYVWSQFSFIVQYVPKCSPVQNQGGMIFHHYAWTKLCFLSRAFWDNLAKGFKPPNHQFYNGNFAYLKWKKAKIINCPFLGLFICTNTIHK